MEIRLVDKDEEFFCLRDKWNTILKKSNQDCFFLTWEWVYTWWKELKNDSELYILLALEKEEIYGIAPLVKTKERIFKIVRTMKITFLGQGEPADSDYLNFIIYPEKEEEILSLFAEYLKKDKKSWDVIDLADILDDSYLVSIFCENLKKNRLVFSVNHVAESGPYIIVPDTWESYLNSIGHKTRYNLRKFNRKLKNDHKVVFKKIEEEKLIKENFDKFVTMHKERWEEKGEFNYFLMPYFDRFNIEIMKLTLEKDWLEFYVLMIDGREEGYLYGFKYNGKIYGYQATVSKNYEKYGIGMLQISYWIKSSIERKLLEFHFLSGDEPHKYKFTKMSKRFINILVTKENIKGLMIRLEDTLFLLRSFISMKVKSSEYLSKLARRIKIFIKTET
ncbi:MAG: GNAT family N-acetyltransferase [bacterium]|nr:GNAT family N-acetyltransferase [bacterium]